VAWIHGAFRYMKRFADPRFGLKVRVPTLIIAAGSDPVCATPATERLAARLKAGRALVIPGARHEIMMERDEIREQFWAAFDAFIPGSPDPDVPLGRLGVPASVKAVAEPTPFAGAKRRKGSAAEEVGRSGAPAGVTTAAEPGTYLDGESREGSAAEELDRGRMDPAVAGGDDGAPVRR
jgi:lysophospholipase